MTTAAEILAGRAEREAAELMGEAAQLLSRQISLRFPKGMPLSASEAARLETLEQAIETSEHRAQRYRRVGQKYAATAKVRREAMTYRPDTRQSWFLDQANARRGDTAAAERLARHAREMEVELAERADVEERTFRSSLDKIGAEYRASASRTDGQGGYMVPPLWLIDDVALQVNAACPLANLIGSTPLPAGTDSISVPYLTVGDTQATQAADNTPGNAPNPTDGAVTAPVVTIESYSDLSQQLLDSVPAPGVDQILYRSAMQSAKAVLEAELISGSGINGNLTGLLNVASVGGVTYTDASPTPAELYVPILKAVALVSDARLLPAECVLMRGARWAWLMSAVSSDGLLQNAPGRGYMADLDDLRTGVGPIGPIGGHPTFVDNAISAAQGAGTNQDAVIVTRPSDHLLWEGAPRMLVVEEPGSGTLTARIVTYLYVAFTGALYPSATAAVTGTGLAVQSGW
jgi:HK97 family phage major capsid protein